MSTDSWLDAHRTTGPLRFANQMGVDRPSLQRGALRAPHTRPQLLVERFDAGALHAAELRCPCINGAVLSLLIETDGIMGVRRAWTLQGTDHMACVVMHLDPALTFKRSLRIWAAADLDSPPWVAIEIAVDSGELATTQRC
jgi:hypothetical protein